MRIGKKTTPWGRKVMHELLDRGWTYADLAAAMADAGVGMEWSTVAQIINGNSTSITGRRKIGDFLNIPPEA